MGQIEITEDLLLDGRIRIRQPARGYRANMDTILIAAVIAAPPGAQVMEAGCGVGAALIAAASRLPETRFVGLERDANMAALARENVALNAMGARAEIVTGDALERSANLGVFDAVFFNPPFDRESEGRAPAAARRAAHVEEAPIEAWIAALADRLKGGATLTLIHRAARLGEILAALEGRLGGAEALPIFPRAGEAALRVLVRARKGSRAPFRLWPGLTLHQAAGGAFTPETEAILRGQALAWPA